MRNDLFRAVLDCGIDDLSILDESEADMFEVVKLMRLEGLEITLKGIMAEIFREGIFRMSEAVRKVRERLESEEKEGNLTEAEYEQLKIIRRYNLNPQSDFTYYLNSLDTHLNCDSGKKGIYEEMFEQEMQDLMDYTGFDIEG